LLRGRSLISVRAVPDRTFSSPRGALPRWVGRRPLGLWRHPDFLRLWSAQGVSAIGSQVTLLALPLTAILVLHARAFEVALLFTAATLPYLVFGIPVGVWVDRVRRRPAMVVTDVGRALLLISVPAAYGAGILTLAHLYVVAAVNGALSVVFEIASQAYLPSVVTRPQLIEANAKFEATRVVAQATGPGAGGVLVSLATAPVALVADAASFVASACLIASISKGHETLQTAGADADVKRRDLREGARYVLGHRYLRPLLVAHSLANLALGLVWSIVIVYAVRELGLTAAVVGAVLSLGQLGGFAGAALGRRIANVAGVGRVVVAAFFLFGPATLLLAGAPRSAAILFLAFGWTLENLARALYGICATSVRQALVPDRLQARVTGFLTTAGTGAFPLGTAVGGALAAVAGLRGAMIVGAVVSFLPFVPVAASPVRSLRELSDVDDGGIRKG
jgi:MFS family permease